MSGLDRSSLDRLIALGRGSGRISVDELRTHLPIASLSPEDIALLVLELEEAGVEVDLDALLAAPGQAASDIPPAALSARSDEGPRTVRAAPLAVSDDPVAPRAQHAAPERDEDAALANASVSRIVLVSGVLTVLLLAVLILVLVR
ncbi:RNA polymerase sigma factor region1.1 domain-containing protein [Methylobacterium oxalidis]|uniref:RNA polymerase sigma factor 70 region 1.1 domain-containing protein n=1 Tax=Methylobacterium oxalidis TaxID=944322 RepID=A0A512JBF5_9HYPH|nr:RNA polymerase sigma factor region1.1 domain-containing protein [Methylobacterium oxalidis]GEP07308.1 hypothetical protein MOX02_53460 [Methylobacterium oxalidis]GJE31589.1 hypothetical protein LDDCCGHA_1769 [Methylobacterium oxalidis]GLS64108.1 hypothetical protein GCM10007888_24890 [Methylobacterium oxalidis]